MIFKWKNLLWVFSPIWVPSLFIVEISMALLYAIFFVSYGIIMEFKDIIKYDLIRRVRNRIKYGDWYTLYDRNYNK